MTVAAVTVPSPFGGRPVASWVSGEPSRLVVALHGYGSSGDVFVGRLRDAGRGRPADALVVAPDGPAPAVLRPGGRQWYPITNRVDVAVERSADPGRCLRAWVELCQASTGLPPAATVVVGFSQGGVMAEVVGEPPALAAHVVVMASVPARPAVDPRTRRTYVVGTDDRFVSLATVRERVRPSDAVVEVPGLGHDMSEASLAEVSAAVAAVTAA